MSKPKDRLSQLQQARHDEDEDSDTDDDYVVNMDGDNPAHKYLDEFFAEVDALRDKIEEIEQLVDEMKMKQSHILSSPSSSDEEKKELEDFMDQIKRNCQKIRNHLKVMDAQLEIDRSKGEHSAEYRIRKTQYNTVWKKFNEVMVIYNNSQVEYRNACKARIQRQLEITGKKASDDEIETMLEEGNARVFTQDILTDTEQARQLLHDIENRHEDIIKLEASIKELHDMFLDMAMLVESQGEIIDRIEFNVESTMDYVGTARENVKKATAYQSSARKKKITLVMLVVCVVAVIGAVVAVSLTM